MSKQTSQTLACKSESILAQNQVPLPSREGLGKGETVLSQSRSAAKTSGRLVIIHDGDFMAHELPSPSPSLQGRGIRFADCGAMWRSMIVLCVSCLMLLPVPLWAQAPTEGISDADQRAIETVTDSLDHWSAPPWYDSATDGEKPFRVAPRPTTKVDWWKYMEPLLWGGAFLLLGLLAYVLIRAFMDKRRQPTIAYSGARGQRALRAEVSRIESLPFQLDKKPISLLDEAERLYREGNFSQAMIYLFSYQLVEMDKMQVIRLTRGKTNRQYLRELRSRNRLRSLVETSMVAFEHVFFGQHALPRAAFEPCWRSVSEFDRLIREGAPAT
jgi:hypothetical protein